jgi:hypothetical protein
MGGCGGAQRKRLFVRSTSYQACAPPCTPLMTSGGSYWLRGRIGWQRKKAVRRKRNGSGTGGARLTSSSYGVSLHESSSMAPCHAPQQHWLRREAWRWGGGLRWRVPHQLPVTLRRDKDGAEAHGTVDQVGLGKKLQSALAECEGQRLGVGGKGERCPLSRFGTDTAGCLP